MLYILKLLYVNLIKFDEQHRDRRSEHFFIAGSPLHVLLAALSYYVFVKHLGPKLMAKRKPYELKNAMLLYNAFQVVFNLYLVVRALYAILWEFAHMKLVCSLPYVDDSPRGQLELHMFYSYFILKLIDYMDTVFMVLRKRDRQISFLHIYHHIMISMGTYINVRYLPGGHSITMGVINSWVHSVMYAYYFISALNPEVKKSLWWKKHITQLQIAQFAFLVVYFSIPSLSSDCLYPKPMAILGVAQAIIMLVLFGDFYRRTYMRKTIVKKLQSHLEN